MPTIRKRSNLIRSNLCVWKRFQEKHKLAARKAHSKLSTLELRSPSHGGRPRTLLRSSLISVTYQQEVSFDTLAGPSYFFSAEFSNQNSTIPHTKTTRMGKLLRLGRAWYKPMPTELAPYLMVDKNPNHVKHVCLRLSQLGLINSPARMCPLKPHEKVYRREQVQEQFQLVVKKDYQLSWFTSVIHICQRLKRSLDRRKNFLKKECVISEKCHRIKITKETDLYLNGLFMFKLNTSHSHSFGIWCFLSPRTVETTRQRSAYGNLGLGTKFWQNKALDKNQSFISTEG